MAIAATAEERRGPGDPKRTDTFRVMGGLPSVAIGAMIVLTGIFVIAMLLLQRPVPDDALWIVPLCILAAVVGVVVMRRSRSTPVRLQVGPEGISGRSLGGLLAWKDVERLVAHRPPFVRAPTGLKVFLRDGAAPPDASGIGPLRLLDGLYARMAGRRVDLTFLDATPEVVIASVERFVPVIAHGAPAERTPLRP